MVNLKATVRVKTKSGLYPVYIRFTKSNQVSYVKTSWVVNEKGLKNKKEITDPFVLHQTSMLIDGYYSQLNLIDTSKWTKSHYEGGMGEYERLKKALAIHEKAAACSASWGLFQIMGFNYAACGCKNAIEAPFIFKHGGYYYLFVSWDYCCRGKKSNYRVAVGRSKDVAGPYLDKDGKDMLHGGGTVVLEGDKKDWEAAGHCAAYTFDGQDIFICHGYSATRNGAAFLIQRPITWTPDGWPVITVNG